MSVSHLLSSSGFFSQQRVALKHTAKPAAVLILSFVTARQTTQKFEIQGSMFLQDLQAAMQFTEAQQQDLMLLRRLFYGKLGVLDRERKQCLKGMPFGAAATAHEVNSRLAEVVAIAQELHDITAAELQTKLQFTSAYRRGVRTLLALCAFSQRLDYLSSLMGTRPQSPAPPHPYPVACPSLLCWHLWPCSPLVLSAPFC